MILRVRNLLTQSAPKTYLTNLEAAGTNVLRLSNSSGFTNGWGIQIGETGQEQSETQVISGVPGTAGTLVGSTSFSHPVDTAVYATRYDQVVFERSTAGTAGTATPMTGGTVTIQADQDFTQFDDTSGSVSYAYKTYFRSSGLAANSTESDWITPQGFSFYSLANLRQRVKDKLWDSNFLDDLTVDNWINEWKDEMNNSAVAVNEDYAIGTVDVAFGTNGLGTITTADFRQPKRIDITYNGGDWFPSIKRDLNDYYVNEVVNSVSPRHNWQGDNVIHVMPSATAGTARIYFYRTGTPMVNDTDELPLSMRSYTKSFVDYALGMAYQKDGKTTEAGNQFSTANQAKSQFTTQITPRDKSSQTFVKMAEVVSGEDSMW